MGILSTLSGNAVPILCGLLGIYVVRTVVIYAKLRHFGGPSWTGISHWPHSLSFLRKDCHKWYAAINEKYGATCSAYLLDITSTNSCIQVRLRGWRRGS